MALLIGLSAFFSASEAALFSLTRQNRRTLAKRPRPQRIAERLLDRPERLLTAVLFWNLSINLAYFAIVSIVSINLSDSGAPESLVVSFPIGSLMLLIFLSEMLPKTLAVFRAQLMATTVAIPLSACVRLVDPLLPMFRLANLLVRRLLWPRFRSEPYLEVGDLERALRLSTSDQTLLQQEETVLQNIVSLSYIRVDELMRPRRQFKSFRPPVSLADLQGQVPPSGYVLVTEPDGDDIASAIPLRQLSEIRRQHLEHYAEEILYVPWSATVASVLEQMRQRDYQVVAVVNEYGETIGIVTMDDILDTIFTERSSRIQRLLGREPIEQVGEGVWQVVGMTNLRLLGQHFEITLPASKSITVAGLVQEMLEHLPGVGDRCQWGPFDITVIEAPQRDQLIVEIRFSPRQQPKWNGARR